MKKTHNTVNIKKGGDLKKTSSLKPVAVRHHRHSGPRTSESKYSDGLVRIYKQEEEDIESFAAFAKTLISK